MRKGKFPKPQRRWRIYFSAVEPGQTNWSVSLFVNVFRPAPSLFSNKCVMYIRYTWPPYFILALGISLKSVELIPHLPWNRGAGTVVAGEYGAPCWRRRGCPIADSLRWPRQWRAGSAVPRRFQCRIPFLSLMLLLFLPLYNPLYVILFMLTF